MEGQSHILAKDGFCLVIHQETLKTTAVLTLYSPDAMTDRFCFEVSDLLEWLLLSPINFVSECPQEKDESDSDDLGGMLSAFQC